MRVIIALAAALGLATVAEAGSLRHMAKTSKDSAPTQEDYEDYVTVDNGGVSDEMKEKADTLNQKTIKSIEELLKQKKIVEHKRFELYLRLGELYLERHDYLREVEMDQFARSHDAWAKTEAGTEPKATYKRSRDEMLRAVNAFRKLVEKFPKHPRTDAALYSLAKTLGRLNNDNCVLYFTQLFKNHPKSPYLPEAYLALGEFYFDKQEVTKSMDAYKEAIKFKDSKIYPYAVYKLGWTFYNAPAKTAEEQKKNIGKSLAAFKLVIKLDNKKKSATKLNLRQEAINDLVIVWAETEGVDTAWEYFKSIGEEKAFYDLLERLGGIYAEQGRNDDAIKTYERLLKEAPTRPTTAEVYGRLLVLHEKSNQSNAVVNDLAAMTALFAAESVWTKANAGDKSLCEEAKTKTEQSMHRYGAMFHNRGQKISNDPLLKSAAKIYAMYLATFPEKEHSYEIRYYLADILFHFQQWEPAADEYLKVAKQKPDNGKYLKESSLNAVVALNKVDAAAKYAPLPPAGQVTAPIAIPRVKLKLVSAIDTYVKVLPKEEEGHPMRFAAAQAYFDYGHYEEAMKRFEAIGLDMPNTKQGKGAIKVVLGFYAEQKNWDELIARSRRYSDNKKLVAAGMGETITLNLKRGVYQKALALEQNKRHKDAADMFLAFQGEFPKDDNADRSLFNASVNFYKVGEVDAALDASKKLLNVYPNSKVVADVMVDMATTWENLAQFDEAAGMYRAFAEKFPHDSRAPGALYNSGVLYKGLSNFDTAGTLFANFGRDYPGHALAVDAVFEKALIREKQKNYPASVSAFEDVAKKESKKNADRLYLAVAKVAELKYLHTARKEGEAELSKLRRELAKKDAPQVAEARRVLARTLFKLSEEDFLKFKALAVGTAQTLEKQAGAKQARLVALANRYEEIINVGCGEFTVASLYRLGEIHENFAQDLVAVQPPQGASQAEVDQFKTTIEKAAFPLKEESYKYFDAAYQRSSEVETFTQWTRLTYQKMGELNPDRFPAIAEQNAEPSYMAHRMSWEGAVARLAE